MVRHVPVQRRVSPTARRHPQFNIDFPLIASAELAYKGIDRLFFASDFRFLDYRDTNGFRRGGFDPNGASAAWAGRTSSPSAPASSTSGPTPSRPASATPSTSTRSARR